MAQDPHQDHLLTLQQKATGQQIWWEDFFTTQKAGLLILPVFAILKYYMPSLPWALIDDLVITGAAVLGISIISANSTKKRHARKAAEANIKNKK